MRIYDELSNWYPLITRPEEYPQEADLVRRIVEATGDGQCTTLLDLGAGAGHMASHLKVHYACTLVDRSAPMLDLSRALNPECTHVEADMRSLDLGRTFDVVMAHDAIGYLTNEADLAAAIHVAARHLRPDGVAILIPDHIEDTYTDGHASGGFDGADGRSVRWLEWTYDPSPGDGMASVEYAIVMREPGTAAKVAHDTHTIGLFDRATWRGLMRDAGLEPTNPGVFDPIADEHEVFVGRRMR